jgi:hypothetical protein
MKVKSVIRAFALGIGVALSSVAHADPINVDQWYTFRFDGPGNPLVAGVGVTLGTNPASIAAPDAPWTFTLTDSRELVVLDGFLSTDRFEIFNFGVSLGITSVNTTGGACGSDITCALNDLRYSRGIFALGPGSYSITGLQTVGQPGAAFLIVRAAAVPEPGVLALLLVGAAALAARRKSKGAA